MAVSPEPLRTDDQRRHFTKANVTSKRGESSNLYHTYKMLDSLSAQLHKKTNAEDKYRQNDEGSKKHAASLRNLL